VTAASAGRGSVLDWAVMGEDAAGWQYFVPTNTYGKGDAQEIAAWWAKAISGATASGTRCADGLALAGAPRWANLRPT
jgi:hypothetical protein